MMRGWMILRLCKIKSGSLLWQVEIIQSCRRGLLSNINVEEEHS